MKYKILGVAGGNGVILHPCKESLIRNIETRSTFKTPEDIQWRLNFDRIPLQTKLDRDAKDLEGVDVIVGAPDCGHSSILSFSRAKKLGNPKDNKSLNEYIELVDYYEPKFFMMENLPKLLSNWGKDIYKVFPNHKLQLITKSVSCWGNSQLSRVRLVVIGVRKNLSQDYDDQFVFPKNPKLQKAGQLIKDLKDEDPKLCNVREDLESSICLYYKNQRNITAQEAKDLWLGKFRNQKRWPVNMPRMKNQPGVYRNFAEDYPLTVRKQNRQFNHWGLMLSPREIARIQGVPDEFKLWFLEDRRNFCINKARVTCAKTPPYEIGQWFHDVLNTF